MQFAPPPVVGPQYCCTYSVDVIISRKVTTLSNGNFVVTDNNGNPMFKVKGTLFTLHGRRVLFDASGQPILTLRQKITIPHRLWQALRGKITTPHRRWQAFRGKSSDTGDLVFTAETSSVIQRGTRLDVFLANKRKEHVRDFNVTASRVDRSCVIYAGEPSCSYSIAGMEGNTSIQTQSMQLGKDKFMVTVYPDIDRAFIVALIVILDEINGGH